MRRSSIIVALAILLLVGGLLAAPGVGARAFGGQDASGVDAGFRSGAIGSDGVYPYLSEYSSVRLATPGAASSPPTRILAFADISVADYRAVLERALADLRGPSPDARAVAGDLSSVEPVTIPDGGTLQPDLQAIIADLTAQPPNTDAASARIEALLAALDRADEAVAITGDAGALLRDVLARDEFTEQPADDSPSLSERFWGWVWDGLRWLFGPVERLLDRLSGGSGAGGRSIFDIIVAALGIGLIAGILVFTIRAMRRSVGPKVVGTSAERQERALSSVAARADADRLAAEGNYRAALRSRYLATLLRLEEAGRLRFDRSLTNREVLTYTVEHGDTALRDGLEPLVEHFDRVWYGGAACTAEDYAQFAALADQVGNRALASTAAAA